MKGFDNTMNAELREISNEYDYSNIVPEIDVIKYLVQYCESIYNKFTNLVAEDEEKNKMIKSEFRNYMYKKSYETKFEVIIRENTESFFSLNCKSFADFNNAVNNGHLKNIKSLTVNLNLYYKRGQDYSFEDYENAFKISFKPYEIKFTRKSNHSENDMNNIENSINELLKKFRVQNSIFCTKEQESVIKVENTKRIGWDDIDKKLSTIYPNQKPMHYRPIIKYSLGGKDPLDGISIYDAKNYYHFVTFGFSEIYEKENDNKEISGFGFELTFKLKKSPNIDENELKNIAGILQTLAKYVFESKTIFKPYEYIYTGQTDGIDVKRLSKLVGFVTIEDKTLGIIDTVNGKVQFIELIGATYNEINKILNKELSKEEVINNILTNYSDITDLARNG